MENQLDNEMEHYGLSKKVDEAWGGGVGSLYTCPRWWY